MPTVRRGGERRLRHAATRGCHGAVRAQTASRNILVEGEGQGAWRLSTTSGSVTVRLPGQQGFTLHAHTVSGSVHTAREMRAYQRNRANIN